MATVGRADAVVATRHFTRHGLLAWALWWVIHIMFLVGFRNRFLMMFHWAWSWLTYKRGARLITGSHGPLPAIRSPGPDGRFPVQPVASVLALDAATVLQRRAPPPAVP